MITQATLRRPARTHLLLGLIALAALTTGLVAGEALAGQPAQSAARSPIRASQTTDTGHLTALGFTQAQAKRLFSQFEAGPSAVQRTAAEAIAMAALWGPSTSTGHAHPAGGAHAIP